MSYKLPLSDLDRKGPASVTQQIIDLVVGAIERGDLIAGEKLPTTRQLAEDAGVNHLTAARAYRRLADEGWVTATVGRGTFVRARVPSEAPASGDDRWQHALLPESEPTYGQRILEEAFRMADDPGIISMATGFPSPRLHPIDELQKIAADVFREEGPAAVGYGAPEGVPALREELARAGREHGFATDASEILVTTGARQGIDLAVRSIIQPGDVVCVEAPTFAGILISLRSAGARVIGIPIDEDGFDVPAFERVLARHDVKMCVLQTGCQNPTGQDLSEDRRQRLAALAVERGFFILEDGVYATLRFDGVQKPRLRELAPGHVVYVDAMSKSVGGGLRVGWVAARGPVFERLARLKMDTDMLSATLGQHIAARWLASGGHERSLAIGGAFYGERCGIAVDALERELGGEVRFRVPSGGHHLWVTMRDPIDERTLYAEAVRHGVAFTPGGAMLPEPGGETSIRISFSLLEPDELEEGIRRLGRAIRSLRRQRPAAASMPLS